MVVPILGIRLNRGAGDTFRMVSVVPASLAQTFLGRDSLLSCTTSGHLIHSDMLRRCELIKYAFAAERVDGDT
jgi:hypothetical protein